MRRICNKLNDRMKILHANKCSQFLRLSLAFQMKEQNSGILKRMFYMRLLSYNFGNLPDK